MLNPFRILNSLRSPCKPSKTSRPRPAAARPRPTTQLHVEGLEERLLLSVSPPPSGFTIVLPHVQVEAVYWGQAWRSTTPPPPAQPGVAPAFNALQRIQELDTFLGTITNSGYMDLLNQYSGVGRGTFLGAQETSLGGSGPTAGTTVTENQITNMLSAGISSNQLPSPNAEQLYIVFLPPNVQDQFDLTNKFAGHHLSYTNSSGQTVYYAVIQDPTVTSYGGATGQETPFQSETELVSHELAEAVTDPWGGNGWADRNPSSPTYKNEIGDIPQNTLPICVGNYQGYWVTELWSNQANASVLPPSGNAGISNASGWVSSITTISDSKDGGNNYIFGIGQAQDVWFQVQQAGGLYSGWNSLGGPGVGVTSLTATNDAGGWRLFVIGTDRAAYTRGEQESGWTKLGGGCLQLATGNDAAGRLDLFTIGTDHRVYEMVWTGKGPTGWSGATWALIHPANSVRGNLDTTVQQIVVAHNGLRQEVFGIATGTNAVWYIEQTAPNAGWGKWVPLGGWVSQLAVGSTTDGRVELFGIGGNHALYLMRQTSPDNWTGSSWVSLGGYVKQIAVGRNLDGREEVFAIAQDDTVWALMEAAVDDAWTDSNWFLAANDKVQALAVVLNSNPGGSTVDGAMTLAMILPDNSLITAQQTAPNGGWY